MGVEATMNRYIRVHLIDGISGGTPMPFAFDANSIATFYPVTNDGLSSTKIHTKEGNEWHCVETMDELFMLLNGEVPPQALLLDEGALFNALRNHFRPSLDPFVEPMDAADIQAVVEVVKDWYDKQVETNQGGKKDDN